MFPLSLLSKSKVPQFLIVVTDNKGQLRLKRQSKQRGLFSGVWGHSQDLLLRGDPQWDLITDPTQKLLPQHLPVTRTHLFWYLEILCLVPRTLVPKTNCRPLRYCHRHRTINGRRTEASSTKKPRGPFVFKACNSLEGFIEQVRACVGREVAYTRFKLLRTIQ